MRVPWTKAGCSVHSLLFLSQSQTIRGVMKVVYFLTRQKRSLAASLIVFSPQHVTMRLAWVLTHYKQVCGITDVN